MINTTTTYDNIEATVIDFAPGPEGMHWRRIQLVNGQIVDQLFMNDEWTSVAI